jgi:hypothetical protein
MQVVWDYGDCYDDAPNHAWVDLVPYISPMFVEELVAGERLEWPNPTVAGEWRQARWWLSDT